MNILDCTHYTTVIDTDNLKGIGPLDWVYGIKLSFTVADTGCGRCSKSGGTCGFDTETEGLVCLCSTYGNSTRECGKASLQFFAYPCANYLFLFSSFILLQSLCRFYRYLSAINHIHIYDTLNHIILMIDVTSFIDY